MVRESMFLLQFNFLNNIEINGFCVVVVFDELAT